MSHEATVFPPMANRSLEFLEERTYSPAVRKPSGMGVRTAHAESMTGGRPGIIIERLNVPTGKFAGSTRSFVPETVMADGPVTRAPTKSFAVASGAISYETHNVRWEPTTNCRARGKLTSPGPLNRPLPRRRSAPGWRMRSRFVSSNSLTKDTSERLVPRNVTLTWVTTTRPLSIAKVAANIGTSVCHWVTFAGFVTNDAVMRRVSTPSTMRVRVPGTYELIGRLAEETLSGVSTVMYDAPRTPAPIQSPGTAVKGRSNTTKKLSPVPAVMGSGAGRVRRADSGVPDGAVDTSGMSRDVFSWPSRSASRHRATLETSPGNVVAPVTSTRTRRRLTEFVGVVRFNRSMGTSLCPGSMVAGARIEPRAVRTSPGGAVPGPKNITAREFPSAEE